NQGQTAFAATGSYGLAIMQVNNPEKPIIQSQLALPGQSVDVAIDAARQLAVVAARAAGLHIIDVSDPIRPVLRQTGPLLFGASRVEIYDGQAYVASGSQLVSIDLNTGEVLQTLSLGSATLTDIAREGSVLYTMDASNTLRAIDVSGFVMVSK